MGQILKEIGAHYLHRSGVDIPAVAGGTVVAAAIGGVIVNCCGSHPHDQAASCGAASFD
jgi:hypothetical protein